MLFDSYLSNTQSLCSHHMDLMIGVLHCFLHHNSWVNLLQHPLCIVEFLEVEKQLKGHIQNIDFQSELCFLLFFSLFNKCKTIITEIGKIIHIISKLFFTISSFSYNAVFDGSDSYISSS